MTLSYAIEKLLKKEEREMSIEKIAQILNEQKEYFKKDRSPILPEDISFIATRLPFQFVLSDDKVDLHSNKKIKNGSYTVGRFDHYRMRPAMYLGTESSDAIAVFFCNLIKAAIASTQSSDLLVKIVAHKKNVFTLSISGNRNLKEFISTIFSKKNDSTHYSVTMLNALADTLVINIEQNCFKYKFGDKPLEIILDDSIDYNELSIIISFDKAVIEDSEVDYWILSDKMSEVALLNRGIKIFVTDERCEYHNQSFLHFPQGIYYLFDRLKIATHRELNLELQIDTRISNNNYQIALGYREDWYPEPTIASYANDRQLDYRSNLVKGILEGLTDALKKYAKNSFPAFVQEYKTDHTISILEQIILADKVNKEVPQFKFKQKKLLNGLVLVCAVRGSDELIEPADHGGWKETDTVCTEIKKEISKQFLKLLIENKKAALKFLWRFDESQLGTSMF